MMAGRFAVRLRISGMLVILTLCGVAYAAAGIHLKKTAVLSPPFDGFSPQAPAAIAISPTARLYVLDSQLAVIVALTPTGEAIRQIGGPGSGVEQFSDPADLCAVAGLNVFIADRGNDRIVRFDRELNYLAEFHSLAGTPFDLTFENPLSVLLGPQGDLFIADGGNDRILKINPTGKPVFSFGEFGTTGGSLQAPIRLEPDPEGGLWALDAGARVTHFDEYGGYLQQLTAAVAGAPQGLAVSADQIWVCSDSLLWVFERNARKTTSLLPQELDLPETRTFIDLAIRENQLYLLDASGRIHRFQVTMVR